MKKESDMKWSAILLVVILTFALSVNANQGIKTIKPDPVIQSETEWVDSIIKNMSLDEKIGQLFMIRAYSNKDADHTKYIKDLIRNYKIGGLCFFQGTAQRQIELTNEFQKASKLPLLISMDAEWGPAMRLKPGLIDFPRQMTMGALQDNRLIFQMGKEVARELKRLGVQINFAPCVDINNNAGNPVIGYRSFGENRYLVAQKAYMYMLGMQTSGIMACAKHFPGHGDTNVDSHYDVPVLSFDTTRLENLEMYPFKVLINQGVQSVMIGHLVVPHIDSESQIPASLSYNIITHWLRNKLKFEGLVFTDALDMAGVTKNFAAGDIEVRALNAGVDVLLLPKSVPIAVKAIKANLKSGLLSEARINESVRKILTAKYRLGLTTTPLLSEDHVDEDLNSGEARAIKEGIIEQALTLVKNDNNIIPILDVSQEIGTLALGYDKKAPFQSRVDSYCRAHHFFMADTKKENASSEMLAELTKYKLVIVGVLGMNNSLKDNFNVSKDELEFIKMLSARTKVVLLSFGNPYALSNFVQPSAVLCAYSDDDVSQSLAAQAVFGGISIKGKLPVTALPYAFESGFEISQASRVGFGEPESVGMSSDKLNELDKLAEDVINKDAAPGCQMLVIRKNKVVYQKSFGRFTYDKNSPAVNSSTLYDLASVTKVAATTLAMMKLSEEQQVDIYSTLGRYLPEFKGSNKEFLILRDIMAHRAGLYPWIPFYESTVTNDGVRSRPSAAIYDSRLSAKFGVKVANRLYMDTSYLDTLWTAIRNINNLPNTNYRYSDLGFIILSKLIKKVSGLSEDQYLDKYFYQPMGLNTMGYLPLIRFPAYRIAPSEDDRYFRQQVLQGEVHDMAAAMLGGVSGHAGLFSNSLHLGILMQMLLNKGSYGGTQYLKPETVRAFTCRYPLETRRGIGFDMPQTDWSQVQNVTAKASRETFGHIGFTGTAVWADPQQEMIFVFLSNRTYPRSSPNTLERRNYRMKAHAIAYDAIKGYVPLDYSISLR